MVTTIHDRAKPGSKQFSQKPGYTMTTFLFLLTKTIPDCRLLTFLPQGFKTIHKSILIFLINSIGKLPFTQLAFASLDYQKIPLVESQFFRGF